MTDHPIIVWFRSDLRLSDHPALYKAAAEGPVLPVFIYDDTAPWAPGAASRWWLHHSLTALNRQLDGALLIRKGDPAKIIPALAQAHNARAVYFNRAHEPAARQTEEALISALKAQNSTGMSFASALLHEPPRLLKSDGTPYRVFTPYYKAALQRDVPPPRPAPENLSLFRTADTSDALDLLPTTIRWDKKLEPHWTVGEQGAHAALDEFLDKVSDYERLRDFPARDVTSRLAAPLHFGEISPRTIWHSAGERAAPYLRQLIWRDFAAYTLYYEPDMPHQPLHKSFNAFPWHEDTEKFALWKKGRTGYPLVDAGIRELWETGTMHNRVRMVTASFLVKHLLIPWQEGQGWFWDTLVDADLANNSFGWQWVTGCGADAAPYFRIFNPHTQAEKFDPDLSYIKKWVPEYGTSAYSDPITDHKAARERALAAYQTMKEKTAP